MAKESSDGSEPVGEHVRIFLRGNVWWANYQIDREQYRRSLNTRNKKEARRKAIRLEAEILDRKHVAPRKVPTIVEVTGDYVDYQRTLGRAKKTVEKTELVIRRMSALATRMKARNAMDIDLRFIDAYRAERYEVDADPKTVHTELTIVRQVVNFALSRNMLPTDPLQSLKLEKPKPKRQPCWSWMQVEQILAAAKPPHQFALVLLAETGMRVGELKWLSWDDVDVIRNVLHVRAKEGWKPKTGDERMVPLSPRSQQLLKGLPRRTRWVLTAKASKAYPKGDRRLSGRRLLEYLKRLLKKLGLPGHLHTFRHSFISHALTTGIPEAVVREWVGHVDREVMKLYTHIMDEASQAAMQRLAEAEETKLQQKESQNGTSDKESDPAQFQHKRPEDQNGESAK